MLVITNVVMMKFKNIIKQSIKYSTGFLSYVNNLVLKALYFYILLVLSFNSLTPAVHALTNSDLKSIINGTEWYGPDDDNCSTAVSTTGPLLSAQLTEEQKIAQTFLVGFSASQVDTMKAMVEKYKLGGIFIVENNGNETAFTKNLFTDLNAKVGIPLIVASDEEGGKVQRFRDLYEMPAAIDMAQKTDAEVEEIGKTLGTKLLSATGVNTVLSPTLDIDYPESNSTAVHALGRTFGSNPTVITAKAGAFAKGVRAAGINPTYKHFPGLGSAPGDSDFSIESSYSIDVLKQKDIKPFQDLVNQHNGMVMMDGVKVPGLTTGKDVAGTSPEAVKMLRDDLKFNGIIMTDDLAAGGMREGGFSLPEAVTRSLEAGVDMPIFVSDSGRGDSVDANIQSAINAVKAAKIDVSARVDKIIKYKNGISLPPASSTGYSTTTGQSIPNIHLTAYSPQSPGGPGNSSIEGGTSSSIPGLDGSSISRTLDDFEAAINGTKPSLGTEEQKQKYLEKPYVTFAGSSSNYRKAYLIPTISWTNKSSEKRTLNNVLAYINDTGGAFSGAPEGRYDVSIGQDYPDSITNSTGGQFFQGSSNPSGIQLIPVDPDTLSFLSSSSPCLSGVLKMASNSGGNDSIIWNFFVAKGLSAPQIAGVMGNMQQESGLNPDAHQNGGGPGYGLIQWGYNLTGEEQLKDWMVKAGITGDHKNINTQLEMVWWHMNNLAPTSKKNMYETYKTITDVEEATTFFEDKMEAAGKPNMPNRIKFAKDFLAKFSATNINVGIPVHLNSGVYSFTIRNSFKVDLVRRIGV